MELPLPHVSISFVDPVYTHDPFTNLVNATK